jgi:hypothetical protein
MARAPDRAKEGRWVRWFRERAASGESVATFCRKRQIPVHQFYWWQRTSPGAFVPVRVSFVTPMIEVVHPRGCVVRVAAGVDVQSLRSVLAALESEDV